MQEIRVNLRKDINIGEAEKYAKAIASKHGDNIILLSMYDDETKFKIPDVDCCGERSWEIYALSRGEI